MQSITLNGKNVKVQHDDLSEEQVLQASKTGVVSWDIETSGLDWCKDTIGTCQLDIGQKEIVIVKVHRKVPKRLRLLLEDKKIKKVFHYAIFDIRFMSYHWNVVPRNIECTKTASKLLDPENKRNHSLKSLLKRYLGVQISKHVRMSDWLSEDLTREQLLYAATDVIYLLRLISKLENELEKKGLIELAKACYAHIPIRAQLDIRGYPDIYKY